MKKLTKLRLINWHLFANETTNIDDITFLTGANGTGKSTIIDAIQTVLLGDTSGRNFNKAANDRTGRTLRGYLRGETGETDKGEVMCLRPGRFTSYIALEFYDDLEEAYFTLGIVFDSFEDESEEHHFFYLKHGFPENNFTNSGLIDSVVRPLTYKEFLNYCRQSLNDNDYMFFDSNVAYQQFLKVKLGNLPDKYFTLFKKAVGFSPITNISNFITEFVCDVDYKIDIEPMKKNIEQYKILELEAKKLKVKLDSLQAIKDAYNAFQKGKSDLKLSEYLSDRADYETVKYQLSEYNKKLTSYQNRLSEIAANLDDYQQNIEDFKAQKESLLALKVGSAGYAAMSTLSNQKEKVMSRISAINLTYGSLVTSLKQYCGSFGKGAEQFFNKFKNLDLEFMDDENRRDLEDFLEDSADLFASSREIENAIAINKLEPEMVRNFQAEMNEYKQKALSLKRAFDSELYDLQNELDNLNRQIYEMKSGRKPFNTTYLEVKNSLEAALKERHPNAKVDIYCDLVDITDKRWTKSIEAAIFGQKFNFFVDELFYEEASKLLSEIARKYNFYNVSVIDIEKLVERNFEPKPGSVAEVIKTSHDGARAYTNYLLGGIKRCETFAEARESGSGLLPNCTGYRGFGSWYLNQKNAQVSFIGTRVDENTMFNKREEYNEINKYFEIYASLINSLLELSSLDTMSNNECNTYVSDLIERNEIEALENNASRLDEQMKEGSLGEVKEIDDKISRLDMDIKDLEKEREEMFVERGSISSELDRLTKITIPATENSLKILAQKLASYDPTFVNEVCVPFFENAMKKIPSLDNIKREANSSFIKMQSRLKNLKDKLFNVRSIYTATYKLSYDVTQEDNNAEFDRDYDSLSQVELPSYEQKINEAHQKAIKEFKDDFIYKLRTSIETVKGQIDELNVALKDVRFGRDSYRFSVQPNRDYIEYYYMITDDLLLNVGDAEDQFLVKYKDIMNNLFNLISDSTSDKNADERSQILENVAKFTDYRTYLVFDLLVKRGNVETESSLARTFKRQSGGETQTPFYISILASFAQLYRVTQKDNTSRLVIFDEAFSKMDGTRIKEAVGLLRSFGLQAILSTPSEKLRDLAKDVDLVLVAVHDVKKNRSYLDKYKEIEKR